MANNKVVEKVDVELEPEVEDVLQPAEIPLPSMNAVIPQQAKEEKPLVTNDEMTEMYKKIFSYCEEDRKDADEAFRTFLDMAVNDGDASHSTKESTVQFLRIRAESADKMTKVMDLLMRYILKERDTFPRYMNANMNQENNIIFKGNSKRSFLEKLEKNKTRRLSDGK